MLGRVSIAYKAAYLAEMNHDAKSLDSDLGFFIGFFLKQVSLMRRETLTHEGLQAFLAAEAFYEEV